MSRKRHTAEEIVTKLRQVDVLTAQGRPVADAIRSIGVTEVTYYRIAVDVLVQIVVPTLMLVSDRRQRAIAPERPRSPGPGDDARRINLVEMAQRADQVPLLVLGRTRADRIPVPHAVGFGMQAVLAELGLGGERRKGEEAEGESDRAHHLIRHSPDGRPTQPSSAEPIGDSAAPATATAPG